MSRLITGALNPVQGRNQFLSEAINNEVKYLEEMLGNDINNWQYGQEKFKQTSITYALRNSVRDIPKSSLGLTRACSLMLSFL